MAQRSDDFPGVHPEPPADLHRRKLPLISSHQSWFRLHRREHAPIYFGRSTANRFNAPDRSFGVLYVGDSPHCSFVETYGRNDGHRRIVTSASLVERMLAEISLAEQVRLVDLAGEGLVGLSADARLTTGDYGVAQRWSLALWSHPDEPDGLLYRSRHDPSRLCVALYNRAADAVAKVRSLGSLVEPANDILLVEILDAYGIGYLTSG